MSFVIVQIQRACVRGSDSILLKGQPVVPPNKIDRVTKIVPVRPVRSCLSLVSLPRAGERLRVAIGVGRAKTGNKPQDFLARRLRFGFKTRLLMHNCHHRSDIALPSFCRLARAFVPAVFFIKDRTNVIKIRWRCRGAPAKQQDANSD